MYVELIVAFLIGMWIGHLLTPRNKVLNKVEHE